MTNLSNRITVNFEVEGVQYSAIYEASYYDNKYIGHRFSKVIKCNQLAPSGDHWIDIPMMCQYSIEGSGVRKEPGWVFPHVMGSMLYIEELDYLLPYHLIVPLKSRFYHEVTGFEEDEPDKTE